MISPAIGCGLFLATFVVARILHEKALRRLSTEQKGRLVEEFAQFRMVALVPMAAVGGLYFAMSQFQLSLTTFLAIYIPAFVAFAAGSHLYVFRKLRQIDFDREFVRSFALTRAIQLFGFALLLLSF